MRFVNEYSHTVFVSDTDDTAEVRAYSVIGRVVDKYGFRIGVCLYCGFDITDGHSERDTEALVYSRVYINRHCAAEDKRIYRTSVDVSRHYYLIPRFADG